jgi:uroporphyrin-III C-methyltransferase/precorrin-2 dehydrogenase/sirohydrochlorin ferrochelatase
MVSLAKQGKRVVRLKGGDPLIFARAGEELTACRDANIAVEVVPGITAAQGAAARLGLPLTDRDHARRLHYITAHAKSGELPDDIDLNALADPATTTAIYMPVRTLAALVEKATGLDPQTPALAVARATRADQQVIAAPIGELPAKLAQANLPGPVLVILGRVTAAAQALSVPAGFRAA